MAVIPLPAPFFQTQGLRFADATDPTGTSVLTGLSLLTPDYPTNTWTVGTISGVADAQLDPLATIIEKLIQQDLVGTSEDDKTKTVNAIAGAPAFDVVITIVGDTQVSMKVGTNGSWSIGKAASLAAAIRSVPGHGAQWVPPAP